MRSVVVNRMVANPATFAGGGEPTPSEAVLTVGWGGINRIDLEPAACADPECDADHGYTGMVASDDFSLRVSSAADGQDAVDDLLVFAESLSARSPELTVAGDVPASSSRGTRRARPTPAARWATSCPPSPAPSGSRSGSTRPRWRCRRLRRTS